MTAIVFLVALMFKEFPSSGAFCCDSGLVSSVDALTLYCIEMHANYKKKGSCVILDQI